MFIAYLRNIIRIQRLPRKVEPPPSVDREFDSPSKSLPPAVVVEIQNQEPKEHLPEPVVPSPPRLSIWV